ncbi:hypothetical protein M427DRAFT_278746 [Gonapodya prolifera JEL478]|uniref:Uncharacterized protein n=1 Tax=Gonapodya prolifera (strain JEL478) TaxID=1344416 RepID=A0A139AYH9_GONPJ|nr:hypothetical protein M427DRAFT_278746 [Gonapodya prolifera JEL478]|eukprot:KXS21786.1 hypothetical protein M427DRAFT_278746 [Gonapodya prolifera JEL478]
MALRTGGRVHIGWFIRRRVSGAERGRGRERQEKQVVAAMPDNATNPRSVSPSAQAANPASGPRPTRTSSRRAAAVAASSILAIAEEDSRSPPRPTASPASPAQPTAQPQRPLQIQARSLPLPASLPADARNPPPGTVSAFNPQFLPQKRHPRQIFPRPSTPLGIIQSAISQALDAAPPGTFTRDGVPVQPPPPKGLSMAPSPPTSRPNAAQASQGTPMGLTGPSSSSGLANPAGTPKPPLTLIGGVTTAPSPGGVASAEQIHTGGSRVPSLSVVGGPTSAPSSTSVPKTPSAPTSTVSAVVASAVSSISGAASLLAPGVSKPAAPSTQAVSTNSTPATPAQPKSATLASPVVPTRSTSSSPTLFKPAAPATSGQSTISAVANPNPAPPSAPALSTTASSTKVAPTDPTSVIGVVPPTWTGLGRGPVTTPAPMTGPHGAVLSSFNASTPPVPSNATPTSSRPTIASIAASIATSISAPSNPRLIAPPVSVLPTKAQPTSGGGSGPSPTSAQPESPSSKPKDHAPLSSLLALRTPSQTPAITPNPPSRIQYPPPNVTQVPLPRDTTAPTTTTVSPDPKSMSSSTPSAGSSSGGPSPPLLQPSENVIAHLRNLDAFYAAARRQILAWGDSARWRVDLQFHPVPPGADGNHEVAASAAAAALALSRPVMHRVRDRSTGKFVKAGMVMTSASGGPAGMDDDTHTADEARAGGSEGDGDAVEASAGDQDQDNTMDMWYDFGAGSGDDMEIGGPDDAIEQRDNTPLVRDMGKALEGAGAGSQSEAPVVEAGGKQKDGKDGEGRKDVSEKETVEEPMDIEQGNDVPADMSAPALTERSGDASEGPDRGDGPHDDEMVDGVDQVGSGPVMKSMAPEVVDDPVTRAKQELEKEYEERLEVEIVAVRRRAQLALDNYTHDKLDHARRLAELQDILERSGIVVPPWRGSEPPGSSARATSPEEPYDVDAEQFGDGDGLNPLEMLGRLADRELKRRRAVVAAADRHLARVGPPIMPQRPVADFSVRGSYVGAYVRPRLRSPEEPWRKPRRRRYYYTSESEESDEKDGVGRGTWSSSETGSSDGEDEARQRERERERDILKYGKRWRSGVRSRRRGWAWSRPPLHDDGSETEDDESVQANVKKGKRPPGPAKSGTVKPAGTSIATSRAPVTGLGRRTRDESEEEEEEEEEDDEKGGKGIGVAARRGRYAVRRMAAARRAARKEMEEEEDEDEVDEEDEDDEEDGGVQEDDDGEDERGRGRRLRGRDKENKTGGVNVPKLPRNTIIVPSNVGVPAVGKPVPAGTMAQITKVAQSSGSIATSVGIAASSGRVKVVHPPAPSGSLGTSPGVPSGPRPPTSIVIPGQSTPRPFVPGQGVTTIQRRPARKPVDITNIPVSGITVRKLKEPAPAAQTPGGERVVGAQGNGTENVVGQGANSGTTGTVEAAGNGTTSVAPSVPPSAPDSTSGSPRRKIKLMVRPPSRPGSPDRSRVVSRAGSNLESRDMSPERNQAIVAGSLTPRQAGSSAPMSPKGVGPLFKTFSPKELVNEVNRKLQADIAKGIYIGRTNMPTYQQTLPVRPLISTGGGPPNGNGPGSAPSRGQTSAGVGPPSSFIGNHGGHGPGYYRPHGPGSMMQAMPGQPNGSGPGGAPMPQEIEEKWRIAFAHLPPGTIEKNPALQKFGTGPYTPGGPLGYPPPTSQSSLSGTMGVPTTMPGIPSSMPPHPSFHPSMMMGRPRPMGLPSGMPRPMYSVGGDERRGDGSTSVQGISGGASSQAGGVGQIAVGGYSSSSGPPKTDGMLLAMRKDGDDRLPTSGVKRKLDVESGPGLMKRAREEFNPTRPEGSAGGQEAGEGSGTSGRRPSGPLPLSIPSTSSSLNTHSSIPVSLPGPMFRPMTFAMPSGQSFSGIQVPLQQGGHLLFPMNQGSQGGPSPTQPSTSPQSQPFPLPDGIGRPGPTLPPIRARMGPQKTGKEGPGGPDGSRSLGTWPMPV